MNKCKHFDLRTQYLQTSQRLELPYARLNPCIESPREDHSPKEMPKEYIDREALKRTLIDKKGFYPAIVKDAIETAPAADVVEVKWISIKDCEPKHNERVLVYGDEGIQFVAVYNSINKERKWTICGSWYTPICQNITHWMPLPAPPKDGEKGE